MKKEEIIERIENVLINWGEFKVNEVEGMISPCVFTLNNIVHLIESFDKWSVIVEVYDLNVDSKVSFDEYEINYEDLELDVLDEVLFIAECYDVEQQKIYDSCRDENY